MSIPFACDMTAIPPGQRGAHHALIRRLMAEAVEGISELPDGLVFRFRAEEYEAVTDVSPERGPLQLRITGAVGVKDFIRAELHLPAVTR
jgi:hypothetical protein